MSTDRIRERVRRLREMTTGRGCTEAEAMAAAEKAAQLMRDHGLSDADIVFDEQASPSDQKGGGQKAKLWAAISACTNTACLVTSRPGSSGATVTFVGREPGPEIAVYLREICERAIDRELAQFKKSKLYRRQRKLSSKRETAAAFVAAMVWKLSKRLKETFAQTTDLTARLQALAAIDERYPEAGELKTGKTPLGRVDASVAGVAAGDKVPLAHGVNGNRQTLAIGSAP